MVPVDVAVHLIPREEQRFERRQSLLDQADLRTIRALDNRERVQEAIDIDFAVRHSAHERVATKIVELVEVQRSGDEPLEWTSARAANERHDLAGSVYSQRRPQAIGDSALGD